MCRWIRIYLARTYQGKGTLTVIKKHATSRAELGDQWMDLVYGMLEGNTPTDSVLI